MLVKVGESVHGNFTCPLCMKQTNEMIKITKLQFGCPGCNHWYQNDRKQLKKIKRPTEFVG